jgi:hypothetical protein
MSAFNSKVIYRPKPRERKTALLYVMRPGSNLEQPVWDLLRLLSYYASQDFALPDGDGLYYRIVSPSGEVLRDTTLKHLTQG